MVIVLTSGLRCVSYRGESYSKWYKRREVIYLEYNNWAMVESKNGEFQVRVRVSRYGWNIYQISGGFRFLRDPLWPRARMQSGGSDLNWLSSESAAEAAIPPVWLSIASWVSFRFLFFLGRSCQVLWSALAMATFICSTYCLARCTIWHKV